MGRWLMFGPEGQALDEVLADRPFSLSVFCPPPGGFTAEESARARARAVALVAQPITGPDPILPALGLLAAIYQQLEGDGG